MMFLSVPLTLDENTFNQSLINLLKVTFTVLAKELDFVNLIVESHTLRVQIRVLPE